MLRYINEFAVDSEICLPGDPNSTARFTLPDVEPIIIHRKPLDKIPSLLRKIRPQLCYDVGNGILIDPGNCSILIDYRGHKISVDAEDDKLEIAGQWVINMGLATATIIRGHLPLHGAGLQVDGRFIAIMAPSTVGKSTLSWHLLQKDAKFACDDLISTYYTDEQKFISYPSVSLCPKVHHSLVVRAGLDIKQLTRIDDGSNEEEYLIPLPMQKRVHFPQQLSAVFLLCPDKNLALSEVYKSKLAPVKFLSKLPENLHSIWLTAKWWNWERLSKRCHQFAEQVPAYELCYNRSYSILPQLEELIRKQISKLPESENQEI